MTDGDRRMELGRREFLQAITVLSTGMVTTNISSAAETSVRLEVKRHCGSIREYPGVAPVAGATWFVTPEVGDGFTYHFPPGFLKKAKYLTADMLVDDSDLVVFSLVLQEGVNGHSFIFTWGGLPQCSFRLRMPLDLVNLHQWTIAREGGFLKPSCGGDMVDLDHVDRAQLTVLRKRSGRVRWCMTPLMAVSGAVETIAQPVFPKGKLLDELGQYRLHDWPGKVRNVSEVNAHIKSQLENASRQTWGGEYSQWGGWKTRKLTAGAGYFRTHYDGRRWWLVDPDGFAFWSVGVNCVGVGDSAARYDGIEGALSWLPDPKGDYAGIYSHWWFWGHKGKGNYINYLAANMIRALGTDNWSNKWADVALSELKRLRFNTVGNWSQWEYAQARRFPYVRPMRLVAKRSGYVFRDFPDVYHPAFEADAAEFAAALTTTVHDPALIGYFMMNEPAWGGFSSEPPAEGMLFNTADCYTRRELAAFLKKKYGTNSMLAHAWKMPTNFAHVESGKWRDSMTAEAVKDLTEFSVQMVTRYFNILSTACRRVDPNHLNLGIRYNTVPPQWALLGMKQFDVFSMNCYAPHIPHAAVAQIHRTLNMPVIIGEFGFGALDVGLPASMVSPRPKNQADRAMAYRIYLEDAVANPNCVGVHWFAMYDESAIGRIDGECYNLGLIDVCGNTYVELGNAAIESNERMYRVADGRIEPFRRNLKFLPAVNL